MLDRVVLRPSSSNIQLNRTSITAPSSRQYSYQLNVMDSEMFQILDGMDPMIPTTQIFLFQFPSTSKFPLLIGQLSKTPKAKKKSHLFLKCSIMGQLSDV